MLNFNQAPYNDDYDPKKDFYRILVKPSVALQARELTQMQTILQNQIKRLGDNIFQNGAMVIPGHLTYDGSLSFVKLDPTIFGGPIILSTIDPTNPANAGSLPIIIQGSITGITAQVISIFPTTGSDPDTIYIKYLSSGGSGEKVFADNEFISLAGSFVSLYQVAGSATGLASAISIGDGVYYVNGIFVSVFAQTLILDKYDNLPSFRIGLTINENIVTSLDDASLLDNATGSPNFAAPGADRYQIVLTLDKLVLNSVDDTHFIELARINTGTMQFFVEKTNYSIINDEMAKRSDDTNGSFTVNPFKLNIRENLNDGTNNGLLTSGQGGQESLLSAGLEPGRAYVKGYQIKTIDTTYVDVPKARDFANTINGDTRAYLGNYCLINHLYEFPTYDSYVTIGLYDAIIVVDGTAAGSLIGHADVRAIEYLSGTPADVNAIYKMYIFNIKMNAGKTFNQALSFMVSNGGSLVNSTGDIMAQFYLRNVVGGPFQVAEVVTDGSGHTAHVSTWDTFNSILTTGPLGANLDVPGSITGGTSAATADVISRTKLFLPQQNILIYPLPQQVIKTIRANDLVTVQTAYAVRKTFKMNVTGGVASFTLGPNEVFEPFSQVDYLVVMEDGASAGLVIDISGSVAFSGGNTTITFTCPNGHVKLSATVLRQVAQEKVKTLVTGATVTKTAVSPPTVQDSTISLGKPDIYRLVSVIDSNSLDITANYTLDNGQRDDRYDLGNISLNPGAPNTSLQIVITFDYFNHGSGDYFSVDSYTNFIPDWYKKIPTYTSVSTGTTYPLRDVYDFRPRVNDAGTAYATSSGKLVKVNSDILADFQYYLSRIDKLYLTHLGEFDIIAGTSSLVPQLPPDPKDGMVLYIISLPAYTFAVQDVKTQYIENKRYTMRDIGKLENRIANIEYYTSLNLLEQQTVNLNVKDAVTGLDRFKNGFLVDNFTDFSVSEVFDSAFHAAIDASHQTMRPQYYSDGVNLIFDVPDSVNFEFRGVKPTNDLVTLPYTETPIISQIAASDIVNVNPFAIFGWAGHMLLTPASDIWKDTTFRPTVLINNDIGFDNITALKNGADVIGTMWGEWKTDWTGQSSASTTVGPIQYGLQQRVETAHTQNPDGTISSTSTLQTYSQQTVAQTITQQLHQSRQGIQTSVVPKVVSSQISDKVLNVTYATFVRTNQIKFIITGMKPRTVIHAFFDGQDVSQYCKPQGINDGSFSDPSTTLGQTLSTNAIGSLTGWFQIPDNPATFQFKTGTRVFTVTDSLTNGNDATTFASANYTASGLLETDQQTITSTRVPEIIKQSVSQTQVVTGPSKVLTSQITSNVVNGPSTTSTGSIWTDPVAQSFLIKDLPGGTFVSSIDLFFFSKDPSLPVTVEIREMQIGLPTQTIVPLSTVSLGATLVNTSTDGSVATTFAFPSPVYLQNNTEYALVVLSDSNNYNVFVATLGQRVINSDRVISQEPYNGVFFESKNASTWTPLQTTDLTFILRRAKFNTSTTAEVIFNNQELPAKVLGAHPFQTVNGSPILRIFDPNHGMAEGSTVTLTIPQPNWADTFNGIVVAVNIVPIVGPTAGHADYVISNVTFDSFCITVGANATSSGLVGPAGITVTEDRRMDLLHTLIQELTFAGTSLTWALKTTTTIAINGSQVLYQKDAIFSPISENQDILMDFPRAILSRINEQTSLGGGSSFVLQGTLSTQVDNLSPVIDTTRIGAIVVSNRCGNATPQNTNLENFDESDYTFTGTDIFFTDTDNSINSSSTDFSTIVPYSYITVSGSASALNDVDFDHAILVTSVTANKLLIDPASFIITIQGASPSITVKFFNNFIDEKSPDSGSQASKYMCRPITLAQSADSIHTYIQTFKPTSSNIDVYYRVVPVDSNIAIGDTPYTPLPVNPVIDVSSAQNAIDFRDYDWFVDGLNNYVTLSIKVVPRTTDSTKVPQFKAFRTLALSL